MKPRLVTLSAQQSDKASESMGRVDGYPVTSTGALTLPGVLSTAVARSPSKVHGCTCSHCCAQDDEQTVLLPPQNLQERS